MSFLSSSYYLQTYYLSFTKISLAYFQFAYDIERQKCSTARASYNVQTKEYIASKTFLCDIFLYNLKILILKLNLFSSFYYIIIHFLDCTKRLEIRF